MKDIVLVLNGLNIINLYAIYNPVTGSEQPIYVVLCVQYETKNGGKDHGSKQSSTTPEASSIMRALSGARCTDVRFYTLRIKIGTNQRALGEHPHC